MDAVELQREIDEASGKIEPDIPVLIRLGPDADVIDLTAAAGVRVTVGSQNERDFTVVTADWLARACNASGKTVDEQMFVTGGPLLVVQQISGESVVRSVCRFLELESACQAK